MTLILHASCVAMQGRGLLILGPSGSGKSGLALQLLGLGADLVADDQTELAFEDGQLVACCPVMLRGLIEARGVGILRAPSVDSAAVHLVADLSQTETERLPPHRSMDILNARVDLVLGSSSPHFGSALLRYLIGGRQA